MHTVLQRTAAAGAVVLGLIYGQASAADFPSQPVRIIVPFGAGDAVDGTARVIADQLKSDLGVPVIVQNVPGAGGAQGTAEAKKAEPDGHTMLMGSTGALTAAPFISNTGYAASDFEPVAQLVEVPIGLAVSAKSPHQSLDDLMKAGKDSPDGLTYSTPGPGSTQHINMAEFAKKHGIKMTHVGGQGGKGAVTKALTREVDFVFVGASNYTQLANAGQLRVLGIADDSRIDYLPDVPTFKEAGYDFEATVWFGLLVPKGTPADRLERLRNVVAAVAEKPETADLYEKFNFEPAYLDAESFQQRIDTNVASHKSTLEEIGLAR